MTTESTIILLQSERDHLAARVRELEAENARLKAVVEQVETDAAAMRDALEQINNLIETEDEDDYMYFSSDKVGEIYESMRNKITSTTAGRDYLDRMRKLESALISLKNGPFIWDKSWTQMINDALGGDAPFVDKTAILQAKLNLLASVATKAWWELEHRALAPEVTDELERVLGDLEVSADG